MDTMGSGDDVIYGDDYEGTETLRQLRTQLKQQSEENVATLDPYLTASNFNPIRVEVEDMLLTGDYTIQNWRNDSGETFIANSSAVAATATTTFSGPSGRYMVIARYLDNGKNSQETINFALNGTSVNSFTLDQETYRFYTRTVATDIALNEGDEFSITVPKGGGRERQHRLPRICLA